MNVLLSINVTRVKTFFLKYMTIMKHRVFIVFYIAFYNAAIVETNISIISNKFIIIYLEVKSRIHDSYNL